MDVDISKGDEVTHLGVEAEADQFNSTGKEEKCKKL